VCEMRHTSVFLVAELSASLIRSWCLADFVFAEHK
jgi:hypothetical protein